MNIQEQVKQLTTMLSEPSHHCIPELLIYYNGDDETWTVEYYHNYTYQATSHHIENALKAILDEITSEKVTAR